jgi:predicted AlkP superfamily pyrophosphatase or phosphodiesterase
MPKAKFFFYAIQLLTVLALVFYLQGLLLIRTPTFAHTETTQDFLKGQGDN